MQKGPLVSSEEATSAAFENALQDTPTLLAARLNVIGEFENTGTAKITAEEANRKFPGMSTPFQEDINPYVAQYRFDQEREKQNLAYKMANGPDDMWTKTKVFGAGLLAHIMDPVEFGVGAIVGWAVGGAAAAGAFGSKVARVASTVEAGSAGVATRVGLNAGREAVGNLAQNVAQEGAQAYTVGREGNIDERTGAEVLTDIAVSTFAATVLGTAVAEGSHQLAKQLAGTKRMIRNTSPEADLPIARATLSALESEGRPDTTPMLQTLAKETSVLPQDYGKPAYKFEPLVAERVGEKVFYAATKDAVTELNAGQKVTLGDDFGFGTHVTDNPGVANAAAARSMSDNVGSVHEISMGQLNPLHLDSPLAPGALRESLGEILGQTEIQGLKEILETESAKNVLTYIRNAVDAELLPEGTLAKVEMAIKENGYNSMVSDGRSHMGFDHQAHNHVTILDDTLIKQGKALEPDPGVVRAPTKDELNVATEKVQAKENLIFANKPEYTKNIESLKDVPQVTRNDNAAIRAETENMLQELTERQKQGLLSMADFEKVKALREGLQSLEDEHTFLKAFTICARG